MTIDLSGAIALRDVTHYIKGQKVLRLKAVTGLALDLDTLLQLLNKTTIIKSISPTVSPPKIAACKNFLFHPLFLLLVSLTKTQG